MQSIGNLNLVSGKMSDVCGRKSSSNVPTLQSSHPSNVVLAEIKENFLNPPLHRSFSESYTEPDEQSNQLPTARNYSKFRTKTSVSGIGHTTKLRESAIGCTYKSQASEASTMKPNAINSKGSKRISAAETTVRADSRSGKGSVKANVKSAQ